jgi:hypothetical protein
LDGNELSGNALGARLLGEEDAVFGVSPLEQHQERELMISFEQGLGPLQHDVLGASDGARCDDVGQSHGTAPGCWDGWTEPCPTFR